VSRRLGPTAGARPGPRGWLGRGRGAATYLQPAEEFRATTVQVNGLYPWATGSGSPMVGVPLGRHLGSRGGATVCCDPVSWFQRARLISNPSAFILGKPGLGKSTVGRRWVLGLDGYGVLPLVLGDLKPDYVDLIRAMGGQVLSLGLGRGSINVLDPGEATAAAEQLEAAAVAALPPLAGADLDRAARLRQSRAQVLADAHGRRVTMVSALVTIRRAAPPTDREESIVDRALRVLDRDHRGVPTLHDLLRVIRAAPPEVREVAIDRGSTERYLQITEPLEATLVSLCGGAFGEVFSQQTTTPMRRDQPLAFDVSSVDDSQEDLQAALLLACWSAGFGMVNIAHALADAGLEPQRNYFIVQDELWRPLRAGRGMPKRISALSKLNRTRGVGQVSITHSMEDLETLPDPADRAMARQLVAAAGMVVCGGLPASEMPLLRTVTGLSQAEEEVLVSWTDPPAWNAAAGREEPPPGRGKFLVKVGGRPGIPLQTQLTAVELDLNDTNQRWHGTAEESAA